MIHVKKSVYLKYNGVPSYDVGAIMPTYPTITEPVERVKEYEIPGRDGVLHQREGLYENVIIEAEFVYEDKYGQINERLREIKKWAMSSGDGVLYYSEDPDWYYIVRKVEIGSSEMVRNTIGHITITFTCDPYKYNTNLGRTYLPASQVTFNDYATSRPIYKISGITLQQYGNDSFDILVNGKKLSVIYVEGYNTMYIDTDRECAYYSNGDDISQSIYGDYSNLFLPSGPVSIKLESQFATILSRLSLEVMPRWRTL